MQSPGVSRPMTLTPCAMTEPSRTWQRPMMALCGYITTPSPSTGRLAVVLADGAVLVEHQVVAVARLGQDDADRVADEEHLRASRSRRTGRCRSAPCSGRTACCRARARRRRARACSPGSTGRSCTATSAAWSNSSGRPHPHLADAVREPVQRRSRLRLAAPPLRLAAAIGKEVLAAGAAGSPAGRSRLLFRPGSARHGLAAAAPASWSSRARGRQPNSPRIRAIDDARGRAHDVALRRRTSSQPLSSPSAGEQLAVGRGCRRWRRCRPACVPRVAISTSACEHVVQVHVVARRVRRGVDVAAAAADRPRPAPRRRARGAAAAAGSRRHRRRRR